MSTTSKFNPISLAIKKKLRCRVGSAKNRYAPLAQEPISDSDRNAEWSVPTATLSTVDPGPDIKSDVFFVKIRKSNLNVRSFETAGHISTSQQGDLFEKRRKENYQLNSLALQYLHIALSHSSMCMTEHYVAMSDSAHRRTISTVSTHSEYLRKFRAYVKGLPLPEAIEEDDL